MSISSNFLFCVTGRPLKFVHMFALYICVFCVYNRAWFQVSCIYS